MLISGEKISEVQVTGSVSSTIRRKAIGVGSRERNGSRRRSNPVGRPRADAGTPNAELAIKQAALDLFAARSFSTVTIKDIARATGLNTALIYYYFGSKEELFRSTVTLAVERAFNQFRLSGQDLSSPRAVLANWLETHVREFSTISKLVRIASDYASTADRTPGIDRAIRAFYDDERDVLTETISAGIKSGEFRAVDAGQTATFISTYLDGVFVRAVILKDFDPLAAIGDLSRFINAHLDPTSR